MTFVGIDPGSTGCVAVIEKGAVTFHDTPTHNNAHCGCSDACESIA